MHGPAGHAVEVGHLVRPRQGAELLVGEAARLGDEPVDLESPRLRVELRHRSGDRVDAPAADRKEISDQLRDRRGQRREDPAHLRSPPERGDASAEERDERRPAIVALRRFVHAFHGTPPAKTADTLGRLPP